MKVFSYNRVKQIKSLFVLLLFGFVTSNAFGQTSCNVAVTNPGFDTSTAGWTLSGSYSRTTTGTYSINNQPTMALWLTSSMTQSIATLAPGATTVSFKLKVVRQSVYDPTTDKSYESHFYVRLGSTTLLTINADYSAMGTYVTPLAGTGVTLVPTTMSYGTVYTVTLTYNNTTNGAQTLSFSSQDNDTNTSYSPDYLLDDISISETLFAPSVTTTAASCSSAGTATISSNYYSSYSYTFTPVGPTVGAGGAISGMAPGTSYTVKAAVGSCSSASSSAFSVAAQLPVTPTPTIATTPATCSTAGTATVTNYNSAYNYAFNPSGPTVGAGGVISGMTSGTNYTVTATNSSSCTSAASASFSVLSQLPPVSTPVFSTGSSSKRCISAGTVTYTATAQNTTGITYSLDATSLAAGNTINSTTGVVTYTAAWAGTATITASAAGCSGPKTATHTAISSEVVAVNDSISGNQGTPIIVNVLANDLCNYDPSTLTIISFPANGDIQMGTNGQITYLPNGSFYGEDKFIYQVCNTSKTSCSQAFAVFNVAQSVDDPCLSATRAKTYYLPFPEDATLLRKSFISAANTNSLTNNVRSIISIKIPYPGTTITYDEWEDGYEADMTHPLQATTKIWGDGNLNNGIAPGYPNDIIPIGGYIVLDNQFAYNPRVSTTFAYDGKDKIFTTNDVVISKVTGDAGTTSGVPLFSVQNVKTNVYDTDHFGKYFVLPFGENVTTTAGTNSFNYTGVFVRSMTNGTVISIDYDGNGTVDVTKTLNEGEVWLYDGKASSPGVSTDVNTAADLKAGATITATNPVGVDLLFGGIDYYGTRNLALLPGKFYGSTYYTPVSTTLSTAPVYAFFTNTLNAPITINWSNGAGASGSVVVPANGYNYLSLGTATGYKFQSTTGQSFSAAVVIDADNAGDAYDWAFNLIPEAKLTTYASVAWAPGSNDGSANYNPVWVTAPTATTVYVKFDGKMATTTPTMSPCGIPYDLAIPLAALQSYKIYDTSDKDQSGLAVYTCDGTKIAAVWGQDANAGNPTPTGSPAQDVGYVMEPRCLQQMILANDDRVVTEPNTPITIAVAANDFGFLCTPNVKGITTPGLQPAHGTIVVNSDGTITYTPNTGYIGTDQFQYLLCSNEYTGTCTMATVTVNITTCAATSSENIIKGKVFIEQLPDDGTYNDEVGAAGVRVNLYKDSNCNGTVDAGEVIAQSTISDPSGNYSFSTTNGVYAKDDFDPTASFSGNDGIINWSNDWKETGDDLNYTTGDVRIMTDAVTNNNAIRLDGPTKGIYRSIALSNATSAILEFSFRRQSVLAGTTNWVNVVLNGTSVYQISTSSPQTDAGYTDVVIPLTAAQINPNGSNTLQFVTGGGLRTTEYYWIDNVKFTYFATPACYVAVSDPSNTGGTYVSSSLNKQTASFTGLGTCSSKGYLGVLAKLTASPDNANTATNIPVKISVLANDIVGKPNPASVIIAAQPTHGTVTVNSDGTITYTPNPGWNGTDTFNYTVCSMDDPAVCSTTTVTVTTSCVSVPNRNVINGTVYNDVNNNGIFEITDTKRSGVGINLFLDANGNGVLDSGETTAIQTTTSASDGSYSFTITPPFTTKTYLDQFNTSGSSSGSNGSTSWTNSWTEIGTTNGFSTSPITITLTNGLGIMGNSNTTQYGACRTADISGAISAKLSFKYTETGLDLETGDYVDVYIASSANPASWTLLKRLTGADGNQSGTLSFDITSYISATTTVRFVSSGSAAMSASNIVYFDDVQISYDTPIAAKYIVQLSQPIPTGYVLTQPTPSPTGIQTASFAGAGAGDCQNDFGLSGADIAVTKTVDNSTPYTGSNVIFTLVATNKGTSTATNVTVNDVLSSGYTVVSATPKQGTWSAPTWTIGTLAVNAKDSLIVVAKVNTSGNYANTATISGTQTDPDASNNTSTVTPVPKSGAPIALNDINATNVGKPVSGNVLTNDSDPLNLALTVTAETKSTASGGSVVLNADGTYTNTPPVGFIGKDTFTYTVCNSNGVCTTATVTINVIPKTNPSLNDNPVANNDTYTVEQGQTASVNVLANDSDLDGNTLTLTSAAGLNSTGAPIALGNNSVTPTTVYDASGTLAGTAYVDATTGKIIFTPTATYTGNVPFNYEISDGNGGTASASVMITVLPKNTTNDVNANDDANSAPVGVSMSGNVLTNDSDPEGNIINVSSATANGTAINIGSATVIPNVGTFTLNSNGTYNFAPTAGFIGTVNIPYTVCDNGTPQACDKATLYLTSIDANVKYWVGTTSTDFNTGTNWTIGVVPGQGDDVVFATDENNNNKPAVNDMKIPTGSNITIGNLTNESTKNLIIPAEASLTVTGTVTNSTTVADVNKIQIQSATQDNPTLANGTLILSGQPCDVPVYATVNFYDKAFKGDATVWMDPFTHSPTLDSTFTTYYRWQHFGVPVKKVKADPTFYGSFLREYDEKLNSPDQYYMKWHTLTNASELTGTNFKGYEITQELPKVISIQGELVHCEKTIELTREAKEVTKSTSDNIENKRYGLGQNIFGNAFTASIPINQIDFTNILVDGVKTDNSLGSYVEKTVYLYNTGTFSQWGQDGTVSNTATKAGSYISIPQEVATELPYGKIPSMNGFLLRHLGVIGTKIQMSLPYDKLTQNIMPQTVPGAKRVSEQNAFTPKAPLAYLKVSLLSKSTIDNLWLFSQPGTSDKFDNGWDGRKYFGTSTAFIFTETSDAEAMQVNTTRNINGSLISFYANADTEYTLVLNKKNLDDYENLNLIDLKTRTITPLTSDSTVYRFVANSKGLVEKRFLIAKGANINMDGDEFKYLYGNLKDNNRLIITNFTGKPGRMYLHDASGRTLKGEPISTSVTEIPVSLTSGVYILNLEANGKRESVKLIVK